MSLYRTILLVDDDPDDRDLFLEALKESDASVYCTVAANGEEACALLEGDFIEKPELIFVDINMPKMNGKELLKRLKANPEIKAPVIIYSTSFSSREIDEMMKSGASQCLLKHTNFNEFRSALKTILMTEFRS